MFIHMIRNDIVLNKNDRVDSFDKLHKSPRVVLQRLNIPLDSVVILKGDTVYTVETASTDSNVDVSISDEEIGEDVNFHEMVIRRYNAKYKVVDYKENETVVVNTRSDAYCNESIAQRGSLEKFIPSILKHQEGKNNKKMSADGKSQDEVSADNKKLVDTENVANDVLRENENDVQVSNSVEDIKSNEISSNKPLELLSNNDSISSEIDINSVKKIQSLDKNKNDVIKGNNNTTDVDSPHEVPSDSRSSLEQQESNPLEQKVGTMINKINMLDSNFTPSRTSERIRNKKEKFSALKLLAGGDVKKLKKEINSGNSKRTSTVKKPRTETASSKLAEDTSANLLTTPQSPNKQSSKLKESKINGQNEISTTPTISLGKRRKKQSFTKSPENNPVQAVNTSIEVENNEIVANESTEHNEETKNDKTEDNDSKDSDDTDRNRLAEKSTEKMASNENKLKLGEEKRETMKRVNDKITLKLEGPPHKKVVNISVSPKKDYTQKQNIFQKLNVDLGPDIIIRRVKSDKSQSGSSNVQDNSSVNKDSSEGNNVTSSNQVVATIITNNPSADENTIKTIPRPEKEIDVPPQIKKLLVETINKNKKNKPNDSVLTNQEHTNSEESVNIIQNGGIRRKTRKRKRNKREGEDDDGNSEDELSSELIIDDGSDEVEVVEENNKSEGNNIHNKNGKYWENKRNDNNTFTTNVAKVSSKKTAKVTPLRLNKIHQPKPEMMKKTVNDRSKLIQEKDVQKFTKSKNLPKSQTELSDSKNYYKDKFDKHFITIERICEHNDSLDSDSDNEPGILAHFVDLKRKPKDDKQGDYLNEETTVTKDNQLFTDDIEITIEDSESSGSPIIINRTSLLGNWNNTENVNSFIKNNRTINDLIKDVIVDLPNWNLHVIPQSSIVSLILLDRESGVLDVKKCIEIDCNLKTDVYIDKIKVNEYCGIYDSLDAIKNLIYQVDLL